MTRPAPEQCQSMAEVRTAVEQLDHEIIRMLGERLRYVVAAVAFKPDEQSITAPGHWERFYALRRGWGAEEGYEPQVIEDIYQRLYTFTIEVQLAEHRRTRKD